MQILPVFSAAWGINIAFPVYSSNEATAGTQHVCSEELAKAALSLDPS
jgi:hypothetical protein